jgi:hypothetical protein
VPEPNMSGRMGSGWAWGDPRAAGDPKNWAAREAVPGATITPEGGSIEAVGTVYQVVVGVRPVSDAGGSASGVVVRYHTAAGYHGALNGVTRLAIHKTHAECEAALSTSTNAT